LKEEDWLLLATPAKLIAIHPKGDIAIVSIRMSKE
jgi:hypothetical protein